MSYAVVMAYVDAKGLPEQRVRLAASLADKFNATLIGLSALAIHPPFLFEGKIGVNRDLSALRAGAHAQAAARAVDI